MKTLIPLLCVIVVVFGNTSSASDVKHPRHVREVQEGPVPELGPEENESEYWITAAQQYLEQKLQVKPNVNKARNVILFLGDGMSVPTITAARAYQNELGVSSSQAGSSLFFESFPYTGLSKTYCVDYKVADSACTSTAYLTGVKGNEGTIGVNGKVARGDCAAMRDTNNHVQSIAKWFQDAGRATGIVTTTRVTHASPAGVYSHTADREWEDDSAIVNANQDPDLCDDIAEQLILNEPGKKFNVILGGGRGAFSPKNQGGNRGDDKDLINEWITLKNESSVAFVTNKEDLLSLLGLPEYLLGLFDKSHMGYHLDNITTQPTLAEMTKIAIEVLQNTQKGSEEGFFLFVEGGKIDLAHHDNMAHIALDETVEFNKAIATAKAMTDENDTLIVVTADHAHTMSISGYPARTTSILGVAGQGNDDLPYTVLNYANGPSSNTLNDRRTDISGDDTSEAYYRFPSAVPLGSETHGGDDVAVFASGPWSHLFTGSMEQNFIPHAMAYASCVGNGKTVCD